MIPLVGLPARHTALRSGIEPAIKEAIGSSPFIGGPWVAEFEAAFAETETANLNFSRRRRGQ